MATIIPHEAPLCDSHSLALNDGALMDQFIDENDQFAFAEIVRRHSAMVLGVCQRVLRNSHDSEDCFQAVFMVLVRKAESIQPREMVGNWLYGVAYRTALEARKLSARRRDMERKKPTQPPVNPSYEIWEELRPVLDQELSRLPDRYRAVLVACDLEGKTRHEAAEQLGLPEGTVASRLARARAMLSKRVAKYSLAMNTNMLIAIFAEDAAQADVPPWLLESTIQAGARLATGKPAEKIVSPRVASLTDAVVQGMATAKLKITAAAALLLFVLCLGLSALIPVVQAQRNPDAFPHDNQKKRLDPKKVKLEFIRDCVLQKIDVANGSLYARRSSFASEDGSALIDVVVSSNTIVVIDGREGTLADLKYGDTFNLEIERQAGKPPHALRIETTGMEFVGVIEAMTERSVTIHADPRSKNHVEATKFDLDEKVSLSIDGKKASKISDLKARMRVSIKQSTDKSKGLKIQAIGPKVGAVIKKIDVEKQTVALQVDDTHLVAEGVGLVPEARVLIQGEPKKLVDLKPGTRVDVQMSAQSERGLIVEIVAPAQPTVIARPLRGAK